jgi:hypothetical protein
MTKPKIDYDLKEASWKFLFLKFVEVSIVLIIIFGFYGIGLYANSLPQDSCDFKVGLHIPCPHNNTPTFLNIWTVGVMFVLLILFTLILWALVIGISGLLLYLFVFWNWNWAKKWAETYESKKKNAIEREKKLRERWTILEDDVVIVKQNLKISEKYGNIKFVKKMKKYEGQIGRVSRLDQEDHTYKLSIDGKDFWWTTGMLKIKEKRENPFIKKLDEDPKWKNKN